MFTQQGPYGPVKVTVANAIATEFGATIRFMMAVDADASEELLDAASEFLNELEQLCSVGTDVPYSKG
ncbi:hypothetical protein [Haladaptatus halobius]|uniref:hypothetical protein n=1 Tax=Haladaptatus halobius TaxID=2884875 RepID=UPI001D09EE36|nr:hypothetical protein [Haladaptatus halobius]